MTKTAVVNLSDAEIKRQMTGTAVTLRDARYPGVRFRFLTDRSRGSWFLTGGSKWERVAGYPQLSSKKFLEILPELQAQRALNQPLTAVVGKFYSCGDLLRWHRERVSRDRNLTQKRKNDVRSVINVQLLPRIGEVPIAEVNRETLDQQLMWSLQDDLSISYVRIILRVFQMAFKQAARLNLIAVNPISDIRFTDFIQAKIKPKPARLHMLDLDRLVERLEVAFEQRIEIGMMALMMLCHGTRITETRKARWRHICLNQRVWVIPADNTKSRREHILPLTSQVCTWARWRGVICRSYER